MFEPESVMPALRVSDMDASVRFYTELLGFGVGWRSPNDGDGENCMLEWGGVAFLLSTGSQLGASPKMTGTLYFNGSGVADLHERIRARVSFVWPLSDMDYGTREFGIRDPDGYVLAFAEVRAVALPADLLRGLEGMPRQLARELGPIPRDRLDWKPDSWAGCPSEHFSAIEQVCHLRDIEREGYQVRIRRMLEEASPSLESLDGHALARERRYEAEELPAALAAFRDARAATVERLRGLSEGELARTGDFAEYGRLTLRALVHYLRSHDQQHLAGIQWLAGRIASAASR